MYVLYMIIDYLVYRFIAYCKNQRNKQAEIHRK